MMSFLFRCLFFLDILFLGLLYTAKFPKRSHYPLRAALACIVGLAVSCGWAALFDGKPQLLGLYLLCSLKFGCLCFRCLYDSISSYACK